MVRTWLLLLLATALAGACGRTGAPRGTAAGRAAPVEADAIARDRAPSIVMPLAPAGAGEWSVERVAPARAELDLPPPPAEPAAPDSVPTAAPEPAPDALKPPIARGLPRILQAGGGGRVTLDVRVDEQGEVSDVELVAGDADTVTIAAATAAAFATRYHPARLGGRAVAVWSRQVFDVRRGRDR
jgi:hypothetical protein